MCGDSTCKADVEKLMDGTIADMMLTDPPYGVSYADKNEYLNKLDEGNRNQSPIQNDHLSIEETAESLWYPAFSNAFNCAVAACLSLIAFSIVAFSSRYFLFSAQTL